MIKHVSLEYYGLSTVHTSSGLAAQATMGYLAFLRSCTEQAALSQIGTIIMDSLNGHFSCFSRLCLVNLAFGYYLAEHGCIYLFPDCFSSIFFRTRDLPISIAS